MTGKRFAKLFLLVAVLPFGLGAGASYLSDSFAGSSQTKEKKSTPAPPIPSARVTAKPGSKDSQAQKVSPKPGKQYEVQPGDTISSIAQANGVDWQELAKYNSVPYPYNLTIGQVITLPGK